MAKAGLMGVALSMLSAMGDEKVLGKLGEILKPHAEELTEMITSARADALNADINREEEIEQKVLEERLLVALIQGTASRRELTLEDARAFALQSNRLARAFLYPLCDTCVAKGNVKGCGVELPFPPLVPDEAPQAS